MRRKASKPTEILAFDLGGTKLAAGLVSPSGKILAQAKVPAEISAGPTRIVAQMVGLAEQLKRESGLDFAKVGIGSAGPLDPKAGLLLDPTNFSSKVESWSKVPLARMVKAKLKRPVYLENDAAAAILAESWLGATRAIENAMIMTLGTGLGTGIIANGKLVRAGRGLHPEAGHVPLRAGDQTAKCGCGRFGCAEAYLSGNGFARHFAATYPEHPLAGQHAAELTTAARGKDKIAKAAFKELSELFASAVACYADLYAPEVIAITGSFAAAHDLFLPETVKHLKRMLARRSQVIDLLPQIVVSKLDNRAGILGAARVAILEGQV